MRNRKHSKDVYLKNIRAVLPYIMMLQHKSRNPP